MAKKIEVDKTTSRAELDSKLINFTTKKMSMNLDKYFGKVKFETDGLDYQIKVRDEWR